MSARALWMERSSGSLARDPAADSGRPDGKLCQLHSGSERTGLKRSDRALSAGWRLDPETGRLAMSIADRWRGDWVGASEAILTAKRRAA